jgi:pimeloyl-ACP methyl ester carboxylesterase
VEPETRYARTGGIAIAYQVVGNGELDLVYVPDYMSNLGYVWGYGRWRDFYLRLARSFRLILFDKRGTGLSDHGGQFAALETRMEDLRSVLDAVGSDQTVILGSHEGCGAHEGARPLPSRAARGVARARGCLGGRAARAA